MLFYVNEKWKAVYLFLINRNINIHSESFIFRLTKKLQNALWGRVGNSSKADMHTWGIIISEKLSNFDGFVQMYNPGVIYSYLLFKFAKVPYFLD